MSSFFSSDGSSTIQFAIIFLVIFMVLAIVVFAFRRLTGRGQALSSKLGARGRQPRLGIVDIYELDRQRQLILLRRDNVEHLLLVGGPNDVVIERNISRGVGARLGTDEAARPEPEPEAEPVASLDPPRFQPAFEPAFEMPVVVAPPLPGSTARPASVGRPLDLSGPDMADIFVPEPPRAPEPQAREPQRAYEPEPAPRAEAPAARPARRLPPSLANLVPGAANRARQADEASAAEPTREAAPEVPPAPPARNFDPAILSDMARQLEQAVRRPSPAPAPVPVAMGETRPKPEPMFTPPATAPAAADLRVGGSDAADVNAGHTDAVDPMAAAMAATAEAPDRDSLQTDDLFEAPVPPVEPVAEPFAEPVVEPMAEPDRPRPETGSAMASADGPVPTPVTPEPPPHAPEPAQRLPEPVAASLAKADDAKPAPDKSAQDKSTASTSPGSMPAPGKPAPAPNPFSVEEIEAEFARLLGRPLDRKG